ncbi:MAG: tRNA lysidine(34) synthetase TilS [Planctomycetes bacterium]|nr:tRNA lysidine(34) synthetase TilS [Planctomycetota bacterium]
MAGDFTSLPDIFAEALRSCSLGPSTRVVLAVSGGMDSMVLMHLVSSLGPVAPRCIVAHLDHGIRGAESRADSDFVYSAAAALSMPFVSAAAQLAESPGRHVSEGQARLARLTFLRLAATGFAADAVLMAHHRDDLAENLLFRLARGAVPESLPGMEMDSSSHGFRIVRPLISAPRSLIMEYADANSVSFRIDSSNFSDAYKRNIIRRKIIPDLEEAVPGAAESLGKVSLLFASDNREFEALARDSASSHIISQRWGVTVLDRSGMLSLPPPLRRRLLYFLTGSQLGRDAWLDIKDLPPGLTANLPSGARVRVKESEIVAAAPWPSLSDEGLLFDIPGRLRLPDGSVLSADLEDMPSGGIDALSSFFSSGNRWCELVDAYSLSDGPLRVRTRRDGDFFHPLGAPGRKKLSDFLPETGVPREERDRVPLVFSGDEILWVVGERIADPFRVSEISRRILRLSVSPSWK